MMNQGQDNVYGLNVNRSGEMSKLAKTILNLHIIFVVAYFVTGLLSIIRGLTRTDSPNLGEESRMGAQDNTMGDILNGIMSIIGSILVFFVVRSAIQNDNRDMLTCTLFCDGCCAFCNCCLMILGGLGLVALILGKTYLTEDLCKCESGIDVPCDAFDPQSNACSVCFDYEKCIKDINVFQDSWGGFFAMTAIYTILVLAEMVCCIMAAMNLSKATNRMQNTPFCRAAPVMMQQGMGQQGAVIVGQPVQGTVVGVAKMG